MKTDLSTAVTYIWISPDNKNYNEKINNSIDVVNDYCKNNNIILKKVFKDIASIGHANKRKEMISMLKYIDKNDIDYLILDSLYSLGRRLHDAIIIFSEFRNRKCKIISVNDNINTETEEGKLIIDSLFKIPQISLWLKEQENAKPKREKETLYNGGACPYGYRITKNNQYTIYEEEAVIVRRIFKERLAGRSLRQIANDLIRDNVSTKRGGKWQANTIKTIIENPFYTGAYIENDLIYKNCHDAIISEYIFNKVNSIDMENSK
jgi:site-specific DNA recombinase